jgi:hypothetical protein
VASSPWAAAFGALDFGTTMSFIVTAIFALRRLCGTLSGPTGFEP